MTAERAPLMDEATDERVLAGTARVFVRTKLGAVRTCLDQLEEESTVFTKTKIVSVEELQALSSQRKQWTAEKA